jgi:hypothetical protein
METSVRQGCGLGQSFKPLFMALLLVVAMALPACRSTYYTAWEQFGKYKRDLLKDNVKAAREDQKEATEQFKDTLTRLKELYRFEGGELEQTYNRLKSDYDKSEAKAADVRNRIAKVEQVAADMFREWEQEAKSMQNARLASESQQKLKETKDRFQSLRAAMTRAESSMTPVLTQLRDHVLYLKHHLNAQAVGSLRGEAVDIEREIEKLIKDMNASIAEASRFIEEIPDSKSGTTKAKG